MIGDSLADKIKEYRPTNAIEQDNVLQDLMQLTVLSSLARAGFFRQAGFHGGTCLRVIHGLDRFSEDLDFILKHPVARFAWRRYLDPVIRDCAADGTKFELLDKSEADSAVKKAFLKTDSIGKLLILDLPFARQSTRKIRIKMEIDINPPAGSSFETRYIAFPVLTALTVQNLESSFATKSHALLCRNYVKGRDWYDFLWYVSKGIKPDLVLLRNALKQQGPWAGRQMKVTASWYLEELRKAVTEIDWPRTAKDVVRFLPARQQDTLSLWSRELFLSYVERLAEAF